MKKNLLVTGGCGFIGTNFIRNYIDKFDKIRVLDNFSVGKRENLDGCDVEILEGDIRDYKTVIQAMEDMDYVVHLAAHTGVVGSINNPHIDFEINALGTLNLLKSAKEENVKKFILASTAGAVLGKQDSFINEKMLPKPLSPYGASKLSAEAYCSAFNGSYGFNSIALRFSNVYGPYSDLKTSVIALFYKQILNNEELTVYGDGLQTRDFLYVDDLCNAVLKGLDFQSEEFEVFQIASATETSILTLLENIKEITGVTELKINFAPYRQGEVIKNCACIDKAKQLLGYEHKTVLKDGLKIVWDYFNK